jgi:putative hydrolase of HD superfamily
MNPSKIAELIIAAETLTEIPRFGYILSGVENPEKVSSHSFNVAFLAMVIAPQIEGIDVNKTIKIALLHDLPESMITDLPLVAKQFFRKNEAEHEAAKLLCSDFPKMIELFEEYSNQKTKESLLIHDLDKLQMIVRAIRYKRTNRGDMSKFLDNTPNFHFLELKEILAKFEELDGNTTIK